MNTPRIYCIFTRSAGTKKKSIKFLKQWIVTISFEIWRRRGFSRYFFTFIQCSLTSVSKNTHTVFEGMFMKFKNLKQFWLIPIWTDIQHNSFINYVLSWEWKSLVKNSYSKWGFLIYEENPHILQSLLCRIKLHTLNFPTAKIKKFIFTPHMYQIVMNCSFNYISSYGIIESIHFKYTNLN